MSQDDSKAPHIPGERQPVRRALVSVYDKTGLEDLVRGLHAAGVAIVSTGVTGTPASATRAAVEPVDTMATPAACRPRTRSSRPVLS